MRHEALSAGMHELAFRFRPGPPGFKNQYPAYVDDTAGETRKALDALQSDPAFRTRYDGFTTAMVYGDRPEFSEAGGMISALADRLLID